MNTEDSSHAHCDLALQAVTFAGENTTNQASFVIVHDALARSLSRG